MAAFRSSVPSCRGDGSAHGLAVPSFLVMAAMSATSFGVTPKMPAHFWAIRAVPPLLFEPHKTPEKPGAVGLPPTLPFTTPKTEFAVTPLGVPGLAGTKVLYSSAATELVGVAVALALASA